MNTCSLRIEYILIGERIMNTFIIVGIIVLIVIILIAVLFTAFYRKVSANEVMVITGAFLKGKEKIIRGGGSVVIPGLQRVDTMDLSAFTIPIKINSSSSTQVPLEVEGTASLNIGNDESFIKTAARKFLGLSEEERNYQLKDVIEGQVRGILGDMRPEEAVNKKALFADKVNKELTPLMETYGVEVMSVQINDVKDGAGAEGYIKSLFSKDVAQKRAEAERASAESQAEARISIAEQELIAKRAEEDTARKVAEEVKVTAILTAKNKEEQDSKQAIADNAYKISEAEVSQKVIETESSAKILQSEKDAIVAEKQVAIEKQRLEAEIIARTNADAEAAKIRALTEKETASLNADAQLYKTQKAAEATFFEKNKSSEAEALEITRRGDAEAESITKRGLAEAKATEALAKALEEKGEVVLTQAMINQMPEIARALAEPLGNIKELQVYNGIEGLTDQVNSSMSATMNFMKSSTGIDIAEIASNRGEGKITLETDDKVIKSKIKEVSE